MRMEIEEIINNLKTHVRALQGEPCETCTLYHAADCENTLLQSAISAMEAFVPRVITYREAMFTVDRVYRQDIHRWWRDPYIEPAFLNIGTEKGASIITAMGPIAIKRSDDGITYRLWNQMPSKERQALEPWPL